MVVEKLPEVNPPSDRVPGRGLLALPISEALRRWNDGEIRDSGYIFRVFHPRGKYRPMEGATGWTSRRGDLVARPGGGPCRVAAWCASPLLVKKLDMLAGKEAMAAKALIKRVDEPLSNEDMSIISKLTRLDPEALRIVGGMSGSNAATEAVV
ncbi:Cytochrome P450 71D8 [Hordeum vulgare]|nr:Cytochrome P450 71D8 [Hordeum vulgare]